MIGFGKDYIDDFSIEKEVLEAFTDHIAVCIANAEKYQKLKDEIEKLKGIQK
ncbi:hypothetical protein KC717_03895 [Candidatus Dojkabacteria bacterium]|uniref:Uncharacterized protein n=1 Tax=Candidatus Dojkabacteria bacterium TaxID=2099670 RepID=A0A955RKD4_9BACT|nr:hypothetical protein [Candidatus Dojkabacteria bacterium]